MFSEERKIKIDGDCLEVTIDNTHVIIEDNPDMWVCLYWDEWDKIKETVEELKKKHENEIKYIPHINKLHETLIFAV